MMIPEGAEFVVQLGPSLALYDVSHLLPVSDKVRTKTRDPLSIDGLVYHHSGAYGRDGFAGLLAATKYAVRWKKHPRCPYTIWFSRKPDRDEIGNRVVYLCNPDHLISWHTGGLNDTKISACFQGNTNLSKLTWFQRVASDYTHDYVLEQYKLHPIHNVLTHSTAHKHGGRRKQACPGRNAEAWIETMQQGIAA